MPPSPSPVIDPHEAQVCAWAAARMSSRRFNHTANVVETVTRLAAQHGLHDAIPALRLAGWLHDAAKALDDAALLAQAARLGHTLRPVEQQAPFLLHGVVAALLAREELGLSDPVIFSAVTYHITGHPEMSAADKAFYLADLTEPGRDFKGVAQIRRLAEQDIDQALLFGLTGQLRKLLKSASIIDPRAIALRNRLVADGVPLAPRK